ncbi:unnamed protein product [Orchesella dallaii]|uniref:Golgi-associated plant pathogenesis-related protein 1 n=1 Tax=Orchesella dallaii TaxID=48710 RepID=A0ABP1RLM3_9HEXA
MKLSPTPFIFLVALHIAGSAGENVTLYEHASFEGESTTINLSGSECFNLHEDWCDRASSMDTNDSCVILWSRSDCSGYPWRIAPETGFQSNFKQLGFNAIVRSLKLCTSPAEVSKARYVGVQEHNFWRQIHQTSLINGDNENLHQAAQNRAKYLPENNLFVRLSKNQNLAEVKAWTVDEAVQNAVKSWYDEERHYDYGNNPGFQTDSQQFTALVWNSTLQVGIGVEWNPTKGLYVVVANYDPQGNLSGQFKENVNLPKRRQPLPVRFYEHQFYEGEEVLMEVIGGCHNLPEGWVNKTTAVKVSGWCLALWNQPACKGNSLKLNYDVKNLGKLNFNDGVSSFNLCSDVYDSIE